MRIRSITFIALIAILFTIAATVDLRAELSKVSFNPDHILKGTTPIITFTLDKKIASPDTSLSVSVGGYIVPVQKQKGDGKLSVQLPQLDFVGKADVKIIGKDKNALAIGILNFTEESRSDNLLIILFLYLLLIVAPPTLLTAYDIRKSYQERSAVFNTLLQGSKPSDIGAFLTNMDLGASGITGLTRGIIAVTLVLILAVAVFHIMVFDSSIPHIAEQLLTLLAGTLTAITGFYFGSKATAEANSSNKPKEPSFPNKVNSVKPKIQLLEPKEISANSKLVIDGEWFGDKQGKGNVKLNDQEVKIDNWTNTLIIITVPMGFTPEQVINVTVKNDNGTESDPKQITITK